MTSLLINNARVVGEHGILHDHAVTIVDGRIASIAATPQGADHEIDACGRLLLPGFIDLQVNGGGGCLFNDAPSVESIRRIAAAHYRFGTTGFLPTLITDKLSVVEQAIYAVDDAIAAEVPGILGIHIEGPFLNRSRKGVHSGELMRELDAPSVSLLSSLRHGVTLVTLAPEMTSPMLLAALIDAGVIVAAGHSDASYEETRSALDSGLHGFTHLFNAMSPMKSREPGVVGAALEDRRSWCGMIVDGFHVHPGSLKVAIASKPPGTCLLVTDAMPGVGSDIDHFALQERHIRIEDGRCVAADGTLAGSNLDMASAVRNAQTLLDVSLEEAVKMGSAYPADALGLGAETGRIRVGNRADLLLADDGLEISATWIGGRLVYEG